MKNWATDDAEKTEGYYYQTWKGDFKPVTRQKSATHILSPTASGFYDTTDNKHVLCDPSLAIAVRHTDRIYVPDDAMDVDPEEIYYMLPIDFAEIIEE